MTPRPTRPPSHTTHMLRTTRIGGPLLVAALAVAVASCGSSDHVAKAIPDSGATLEGTVKAGTEQLHYALIMVKSPNGSASGKIDEDGRYKISNVPLGEVQVGVNTSAAQGDYQTDVMQAGAMTGGPEGKSGRKKVNVKMTHLKDKFFDPTTSGLKTTVKAGANTFDIELPAAALVPPAKK
jgi:hypothetical protein